MLKRVGAAAGEPVVLDAASPSVVIPDADALFQGDFERVGNNLVIHGTFGGTYVVRGFFSAAEAPILTSPDGAILLPDVARALAGEGATLDYVQAAGGGASAIGRVDVLTGAAFVQRAGGGSQRLASGDAIHKGDVVSTQGAGSVLGIKFVDGTVFSLSANARMVINDLVYSAGSASNSMTANLIQGAFVFVAGQTATTGDMKINTPVATMGIRGTTPTVNINANNGQTTFGILPDPDTSRVGTYDLLEVLTGRLIRSVNATGRAVLFTSVGTTPLDRPYTAGELALSQQLQTQITNIYRNTLQTPPVDSQPPQQVPQPGDRGDIAPQKPLVGNIDVAIAGPNMHLIHGGVLDGPIGGPPGPLQPGGPPGPYGRPPMVAIGLVAPDFNPILGNTTGTTGTVSTSTSLSLVNMDGGTVTENAQIVFFDLAQGLDNVSILNANVFTLSGDAIAAFLTGTTLSIDPAQFKYLTTGESMQVAFNYSATNGNDTASATGALVVTGINDSPVTGSDSASATAPGDAPGTDAYGNVLTNDMDIDSGGPFTIASVDGIVPNSPIVVHGIYGTLTVESTTGGFVYVPSANAASRALGQGAVGSESFTYIVRDPDGGRSPGTLTISLTGQNDTPVGLDDTGTTYAAGIANAVAASGNLLANDTDVDVGDVLLVTAVDIYPMPSGGVTPITVSAYYGDATFYADGTYIYTPGTNPYSVADLVALGEGQSLPYPETFYYQFADGYGGSASAHLHVYIYGQNDAPLPVLDTVSVTESGTGGAGNDASGNALSNDSDPDTGDTLTVTHLNGIAVNVGADAINGYGRLSVLPDGNWTFTVDQFSSFVNSLAFGTSTTFSHTITVADSHGASANSQIEITVHGDNDAPVAGNDTVSGSEGSTATIAGATLFANDTDPDAGDTKSIYSLTAISGGAIGFSGPNTVNIVPDAYFSGQGQFAYTLQDAQGATSYGAITFNVAPVAQTPTLNLQNPTPFAIGNETQVNTYTSTVQSNAAIAALSRGGTVVVWESYGQDGNVYGIFGRHFGADGTPAGAEFQINTTTSGEQESATVTALADGGYVVMWMDNNNYLDGSGYGIIGRRFDAIGNPITGEFQVNSVVSGEQTDVAVAALSNGGFVAVWESQHAGSWDIYGQRFNAAGNPDGAFTAHTASAGTELSPHVEGLANGGFVVTWTTDNLPGGSFVDIGARVFDSSLTPVGPDFMVNTATSADQHESSVIRLAGGAFVVVWESYISDSYDIRGQMYAGDSTPIGTEFQINTTTTDDQRWPSLARLSDGGFVVTWTSQAQDGSAYGVYGQRFSAAGAALGGEFLINQSTTGDQYNNYPQGWQIVQQTDGTIVAVWEGEPFVNQGEVYMRRFGLPGTGTEDTPINLGSVHVFTPDTDGSEVRTAQLSGFPAGATFNFGAVDPGDNTKWNLSSSDLGSLVEGSLVLTPPANWNGTFTLTVEAKSTDTAVLTKGTATDSATSTATMIVTVFGTNDAPVANDETVFGYNTAVGTNIHIPNSAILFNDTDADHDSTTLNFYVVNATPVPPNFGYGGLDFQQQPLLTGPETITYNLFDPPGLLSNFATITVQDSVDLSTMNGSGGDDILITTDMFYEVVSGGAGKDVFVIAMDTLSGGAEVLDYTQGEDAIWVPVAASAIGSGQLSDFVQVLDGTLQIDLDGTGAYYGWQNMANMDNLVEGSNDVITVLLDDSSSWIRGDIVAQFTVI